MPPSDVRCVCFDLGGVLVRVRFRWDDVLASLGIEPRMGAGAHLTDLPQFDAFQAGRVTQDDYYAALARFLGIEREAAREAHDAVLVAPYPDTVELVRDLRRRGLATGCLSNTNAPHWEIMLHSGRFPNVAELDFALASHVVCASKPDEAAYRAFEHTSGFRGAEIAFFDDGRANVEAARALGWQAHEVPEGSRPADIVKRALGLLP